MELQKEISQGIVNHCWVVVGLDYIVGLVNHNSEFIKTIIPGDETWVYGGDLETKFQS